MNFFAFFSLCLLALIVFTVSNLAFRQFNTVHVKSGSLPLTLIYVLACFSFLITDLKL